LLLGNGTGEFTTPQTGNISLPYIQSRGDCQGDFNGDGILDKAYTGASSVTITLGTGQQTSIFLNASPHSVRIGDFNSDNKLDLVTSNWDKNNISVLLGNGLGGFSSPRFSYWRCAYSWASSTLAGDKRDVASYA
jgi:hypothetical protein